MNYIRELNAFRDWLMLNPLTTSGVALWYTLMSINNMAGWTEWFAVPNSTLQQLAKLSKQGLADARNELKQKGLIDYRPGNRKQSGQYKMISLVNRLVNSVDQIDDQTLDQTVDQSIDLLVDQTGDRTLDHIYKHKQNKTKQNNTPTTTAHEREENAFDLFEREGFGTISPFLAEQISDLIDTYTERWVVEAMKEAVLNGKRNIRYVEAILRRWQAEGIDSPWERRVNDAKSRASPARDSFDYDALSL